MEDNKSESEKSEKENKLDEPILPDDYPVYGDYFYVADGKPIRSNWHDITVRQLKNREGYKEVRRCDIYGRKRLHNQKENDDNKDNDIDDDVSK